MRVLVRMRSAGVDDLLKSGAVLDDLAERGAKVLAAAQAAAPVSSGAYRDSLHVIREAHASRGAVHVSADVPYAMYVQSRTGNLLRALDAAG